MPGSGVENEPARPVANSDIATIEPFVSRHVWTVIQLQLQTGMRPQETPTLRLKDLERSNAGVRNTCQQGTRLSTADITGAFISTRDQAVCPHLMQKFWLIENQIDRWFLAQWRVL